MKSQIWIAVSVYVLIAIIKKRRNIEFPLYTLLQIPSVTLFEKMPLPEAFHTVHMVTDGAGLRINRIIGSGRLNYIDPFVLPAHGVVDGASNSEIRSLTVKNTGGGFSAVAVLNAGKSPRMTSVTAHASGGIESYGIDNSGSSSLTMDSVTATAAGGANINCGVKNDHSSPTMTNVTAVGRG